MRPGRARLIGRICVATAVTVLALVVAALWVLGVPQ